MSHLLRRRTLCLGTLLSGQSLSVARAQPRPFEIGVLPNLSARVLLSQYEPMRGYLERVMNRPVQISTAPSWATFHHRTVDFHYDIVVTSANLARIAQIDFGFVPLVCYSFADVPGFVVMASPRLSADETRAFVRHLERFAAGTDEGRAFFAASGSPTCGLQSRR